MIDSMLIYQTEHVEIVGARTYEKTPLCPAFSSAHLVITGKHCRMDISLFGEMLTNKPFTEVELIGTKPATDKPLETSLTIHGVKGIELVKTQAVDSAAEWNNLVIDTDRGKMTIHLYSANVRQDDVVLY